MPRMGGAARTEERIVDLAESQERALMERLDRQTAAPGVGQAQRKREIANQLLASEDPALLARLRIAAPYMTASEKGQVERRIRRTLDAP